MAQSIEQARREVHTAFATALAWADRDERTSFYAFETKAWSLMLALGRALVLLFLARQANRFGGQYTHGRRRYRVAPERSSDLGTRFGKVVFCRPTGRVVQGLGAVDLPVDRELALCSGFSLSVVLDMARLCAQMSYAASRDTYRHVLEWSPSPRAVMRMVDAVGDEARRVLEQAPAPDEDGEVLVLQVDGRGAPMISEIERERRCRPHAPMSADATRRHGRRLRRQASARPRRTKGKKSKNAKVAVVGVIYGLRRTPAGMEGPIHKRIYATFESHEALFVWLHREAVKRGYGRKQVLFLADGSEHIWRLKDKYFPEAESCLDWYHAVEKLWMAGECLHGEGTTELKSWIDRQVARLRRGANGAVLAELRTLLASTPRTGPGNKGRRERLAATIRYYEANRGRMPYGDLRKRDLDIGTGAVEGAVRNLVAMRLDGPGMRWSRQRSERLLYLRCILLNGQWAELTEHLARLARFKLPAQPEPTRAHTAKAVA